MRHPDPHFGYPTVSWKRAEPRATPSNASAASPRFLRQGTLVLDTHVDAIDLQTAVQRIFNWGSRHQSRFVALCSMEALVLATRDAKLHHGMSEADLTLAADGGVAWSMRREGQRQQQALKVQDVLWQHLELAQQAGHPVHFHGGTPASLEHLLSKVRASFPLLQATGTPGTRQPPMASQDLSLVHEITATGAPVVFLGLPHAEQARWAMAHRSQVRAVMVGLGPDFGMQEPALSHRVGTRAVFFARVLQSLLLGTPATHHDERRP